MDQGSIHILRSKLRPPVVKDTVSRPRLLNRLLDNSDKRIVVIRADAGYGKTTLAAQYLQASGARGAWYRLDEGDREPLVFLTYLAATLDSTVGSKSADSHETWHFSAVSPGLHSAAQTLAARVEQSAEAPALLVLDDYHAIDGSCQVRKALQEFIVALPSHLQVAIVTRTAPSLSLARMAAAGELLRLDSTDLEFSAQETQALWTAQGWSGAGDEAVLQKVRKVTHGWAAGLVLFADCLQQGREPSMDAVSTASAQEAIYEYLAEEVFDRQPTDIQEFLLSTCVLDEIGVGEAARFGDVSEPLGILDRVEKQSLFFRRIQTSSLAYQCHPLLREFLERRLRRQCGDHALARLHGRAAMYYCDRSEIGRAVRHAVRSGDGAIINAVGQQHAFQIADAWRSDLAAQLVAAQPDSSAPAWALALKGYLHRADGEHERAVATLLAALELVGPEDDHTHALVLQQLSWAYGDNGEHSRAVRTCSAAIEALKPVDHHLLALSRLHMHLSWCEITTGEVAGGLAAATKALTLADAAAERGERALMETRYGQRLHIAGRLLRAAQRVDAAMEVAERERLTASLSWVAVNCSAVARDLGLYDKALERAESAVACAARSATPVGDSVVARDSLAEALLGLGRIDEAKDHYLVCLDAVSATRDRVLEAVVCVGLSACARTQQEGRTAQKFALEATERIDASDRVYGTRARLARVGAMVACGDLARAISDLKVILRVAAAFGQHEAWCRFLLAHIALRQGRLHHCDQHLSKALSIAGSNRYVHLMIVEGRIAPEVLVRALEADIETEFACEILSRIGPWLLPHAQGMLKSGDKRMALLAARILGDTKRSWARKPLLDAVRSRDPDISKLAAEVLASLPVQQEEKLRIAAFGSFRVLCGEREVLFKKRKSRHLLEYFFVNRASPVAKDVVIDTFWPDSTPKAALNNFHVTFHSLKRGLNPHLQRRELLPYLNLENGCMQLACKTFSSDVDDFLEARDAARQLEQDGNIEDAIEKLQMCRELYQGDLMEDNLYEEWAIELRQDLRETYFETMAHLARLLDGKADHQLAARILRRLVAKDRTREELHLALAEQYVKMGNRALAASQRKLCERALADELGVEMSSETSDGFDRLLAVE